MKKIFTLLLLVVSLDINAQVNPTLSNDLQNILDNNIAGYGLEGVEMSVILPDGCHWTGVSGIAGPSDPVDTTRIWHWGSVGKSMTAAIILQLVESGDLNLDDVIGTFVPTDTIAYIDSTITIKMLLNHTTNLANSWVNNSPLWIDVFANRDSVWNIENAFHSIYRLPQISNPDTNHIYNGFDNYVLLGFVIEAVTGNPLEVEYQNRLFTPLNMNKSTTGENGVVMTTLNGVYSGTQYRGNWEHHSYMSTRGGEGTYMGSTYDVAKFMRAFHNDELVGTTLMDMARDTTKNSVVSVPGTCLGNFKQGYGFGTISVKFFSGSDTISFYGNGGNGLGNSIALHVPDSNFTITLTTNDLSSTAQQTNFALFTDLICHIWSNWSDVTCSGVGIEEKEMVSFKIYPNPGTDMIYFEGGFTPEKITVTDISGRIVGNYSNVNSINLFHLPMGTYFISLENEHYTATEIWIKE